MCYGFCPDEFSKSCIGDCNACEKNDHCGRCWNATYDDNEDVFICKIDNKIHDKYDKCKQFDPM